jgi:hypothetical protein
MLCRQPVGPSSSSRRPALERLLRDGVERRDASLSRLGAPLVRPAGLEGEEQDGRADDERPKGRCRAARRRGRSRARVAGGGEDDVHLREEAIAAPRQRLEEARRLRIVAERAAHAVDAVVEAPLVVDVAALRPEREPHLVARDDLAGVPQQLLEHGEGLGRQRHGDAAPPQLAPLEVELEHREAQDVDASILCGHGSREILAHPSRGGAADFALFPTLFKNLVYPARTLL